MQIENIESGAPAAPESLSLPEIIARLDSENSDERYEAMRVLANLGVKTRRTVQAVKDDDPRVRVLAVKNLGSVGGPLSLGVLEALLVDPGDADENEKVRGAAARAIQDLALPAGIPVLLAALDDESHYVYRLVIEALRSLGGRSFVDNPALPIEPSQREELTKAWRAWWRGPRAFARKLDAAKALEELRLKRLSVYLVALITDEDRPVAAAAKQAFEALAESPIGPDSDLDTPDGRQRLRKKAVELYLARFPKARSAGDDSGKK
jgi:HEAT repeat protein